MNETSTITRHPIRAAIYGLLLGFSVAVYLILFAVIAFGDWVPLIIVLVAGIVVGILWAYVAPAKGAKDAPGRGPEGRSVPEYGGVEQVTVGPYSSDPTTAAPRPTQPQVAAEPPPAAVPPPADAPTDVAADDDSGEFDADV